MSRQEKFSIRKTTRGVVSACIAVVGLLALMGANQEVKADEVNVTVAETAVVENDEANEDLAVLAATPEENPVEVAEQELATAQEELAVASQALAQAQDQEAAAEVTLTKAQAAVDAVETNRTETRQVGTTTETVQTGTKTETVQTGTRTEQVQVGTESKLVEGTRTEQVQTGTKTSTKYVGMETVQEQTGTEIQRVKVGEEEVQVQVGSTFETKVVGTETKTEIVGYKTEQVKVGERTVTEGGKAGLKPGTMKEIYSEEEGIIVTDAYLTAIKNLANGTGTANDVRTAIQAGDGISGLGLHQFLANGSASNYGLFYENHQYDLANSDKTTKYDVLDLPYEVRKDLALFYAALINDVRAKVGTEPLKVTDKYLEEAYKLVDQLRVANTKYDGGKRSEFGTTILEDNHLANVPRSALESEGYFVNQKEEGSKLQSANLIDTFKEVAQTTNSELVGMNYLSMQSAGDLFTNKSFAGNHSRYQTIDNLKYGILSLVGQQLFGNNGRGNVGNASGGFGGNSTSNYQLALKVLGLDDSKVNTVGFDTSFYKELQGWIAAENEVLFTFSRTNDTALTNPYETSTGGTTRVEDVYETKETPIYETKTVDVTERVEVPVYRTQVRDVYEDREVPTYTNVTRPKYETVEEPVYEEREVAYSEVVETPIYETREVPVYTEVETPIYETREVPVYETVNITVAIPQDLLDALTAAQEAYDKSVADSQTAQGNYQEAADKVTAAQAKLAALQPAPQPVEDTPTTGDQEPSPAETEPVSEEEQVPTETNQQAEKEQNPTETEQPVEKEAISAETELSPQTEDKATTTQAGGAGAESGQDKPVTSRLTGIGSSERPVITATTTAPSYSRVARHQADKSLPNTGDTNAIISLLGLAVAGLGMVGLKRKRG